jgi:hypothetical protein
VLGETFFREKKEKKKKRKMSKKHTQKRINFTSWTTQERCSRVPGTRQQTKSATTATMTVSARSREKEVRPQAKQTN